MIRSVQAVRCRTGSLDHDVAGLNRQYAQTVSRDGETYLRSLAEAELRRAIAQPRRHPYNVLCRVQIITIALTEVGAISTEVADSVVTELEVALAARRRLGDNSFESLIEPDWRREQEEPPHRVRFARTDRTGDEISAALPLSWLVRIWAAGLAVVEGRLVVDVAEVTWPAAVVLAISEPGQEPERLSVWYRDRRWSAAT